MKQQNRHIFDDPKNVTWFVRLIAAICFVLFVLDFILLRHSTHTLDGIVGFYAFYGFIGCVLLVIIAKWLRAILMRPEEYYEKQNPRLNLRQKQRKTGRQDNAEP